MGQYGYVILNVTGQNDMFSTCLSEKNDISAAKKEVTVLATKWHHNKHSLHHLQEQNRTLNTKQDGKVYFTLEYRNLPKAFFKNARSFGKGIMCLKVNILNSLMLVCCCFVFNQFLCMYFLAVTCYFLNCLLNLNKLSVSFNSTFPGSIFF